MIQDSLLADRGEVFILVGKGESPYRVVTAEHGGGTVSQTGWCKTHVYVEGVAKKLAAEGYRWGGEHPLTDLSDEMRQRLRVSRFHMGELKSALQKYVRRGEHEKALNVAWAVMGEKDGFYWLSRRLPIFAMEDVGWEWIGQTVTLCREASTDQDMLEVVSSLSRLPKSKEAAWLLELGYGWLRKAGDRPIVPSKKVIELVDERLEEAATLTLMARHRDGVFLGSQDMKDLQAASAAVSDLCQLIVDGCSWRMYQHPMGEWDGMGFIASMVMAIARRIEQVPSEWPDPDVPAELRVPEKLDWYVFDQHTLIGKRMISRLSSRGGMTIDQLNELMFNYSSAVLNPKRADDRYEQPALEMIAQSMGFSSEQDARFVWESVQAEARRLIESMTE